MMGQMAIPASWSKIARTVRPRLIIRPVFPSQSFMNSFSIPGKRQTALVAIRALKSRSRSRIRKKIRAEVESEL